ncbi:hypothetical protein ABZW18_11200 [Streptomyces sp. NPDC004647]|uniref:hypothetical protein n=1 Tax=Streptomyces sp. NPDC004647 TaxID=3154671 RepID=UPI0033AE47A0
MTAAVGGGAGVLGAFIGFVSTRHVEAFRIRAALMEKAEERRLAAIERFLIAVHFWMDGLLHAEERGWDNRPDDFHARVLARDEACRRLMLLASEEMYQWISEEYCSREYELKKIYVYQVRGGMEITEEARQARREFSRMLREELIPILRPEVAALRDPMGGASGSWNSRSVQPRKGAG